jgi:hypothetical protein
MAWYPAKSGIEVAEQRTTENFYCFIDCLEVSAKKVFCAKSERSVGMLRSSTEKVEMLFFPCYFQKVAGDADLIPASVSQSLLESFFTIRIVAAFNSEPDLDDIPIFVLQALAFTKVAVKVIFRQPGTVRGDNPFFHVLEKDKLLQAFLYSNLHILFHLTFGVTAKARMDMGVARKRGMGSGPRTCHNPSPG